MNVTVPEEDRQVVVLALAVLSIQRPGWLDYLQRVAKRFDPDLKMFEDFRKYNSDKSALHPPKYIADLEREVLGDPDTDGRS